MRRIIVGVMGPGDDALQKDIDTAYELGRMIGKKGWVVLSGGRNVGVMDAVSRGAQSAGGLTIGILPSSDFSSASDSVDIAIMTGMGDGRNNINVLSSDVIVVCGMNPGTASEVALALKIRKKVILINAQSETIAFFKSLNAPDILVTKTINQVINYVSQIVTKK